MQFSIRIVVNLQQAYNAIYRCPWLLELFIFLQSYDKIWICDSLLQMFGDTLKAKLNLFQKFRSVTLYN